MDPTPPEETRPFFADADPLDATGGPLDAHANQALEALLAADFTPLPSARQRQVHEQVQALVTAIGLDPDAGTDPGAGPLSLIPLVLPHDGGPGLPVRDAVRRLGQLIGQPDLSIPEPKASAVMCFLDAYPEFFPKLAATTPVTGVKAIAFNSSTANSWGGGVFNHMNDCTIHLSELKDTTPSAFARLLVHEMGHATFQRMLLNSQPLPLMVDRCTVSELLDNFAAQTAIAETLLTELSTTTLRLQHYWTALPAAAKTFYHSWLILRRNKGQHLLGMDLGKAPNMALLTPSRRQSYQANDFSEFCAETFMQYAMGDLHPHVRAILANGAIGADVKVAWCRAWHILDLVAAPILGQRRLTGTTPKLS